MKTAEETLQEFWQSDDIYQFDECYTSTDVMRLMKSYAKQVAEQALKDASVKAGNFFNDFAGSKKEDVKQARISSILNTEIKTP